MSAPAFPDSRSTCAVCGVGITYYEHSQWAGTHFELLDAWWAHDVHPADDHAATPTDPGPDAPSPASGPVAAGTRQQLNTH